MSSIDYYNNVVADIHAHAVLKNYLLDLSLTKDYDTTTFFYPFICRSNIPKMIKGAVDIQFSTIYLPEKPFMDSTNLDTVNKILKVFHSKLNEKCEQPNNNGSFKQTMEIIKKFESEIEKAKNKGFNVDIPKSKTELKNALDAGKFVFLHCIEGAHSLGRNLPNTQNYLDNLKEFYNSGVCMITLAHFCSNDLVSPVMGVPPSMQKLLNFNPTINPLTGLTEIGKIVVKEMFDIGILVDLTHSTPKARQDIFEINNRKRPLVFSHVGISKIFKNDMNPTDEEVTKIKECNGIIGLILDNYWLYGNEDIIFIKSNASKKLLKSINYIKSITGTYDNIAIGSDFDGFTDPSDDFKDSSRFPYLYRVFLEGGIPEKDIFKILGGNVQRVLNDGWER